MRQARCVATAYTGRRWRPAYAAIDTAATFPVQYMTGHESGAAALMRRAAPCGVIWTAKPVAATSPSLRITWTWSPPGSTSVAPSGEPGPWIRGVQSASYSVTIPDVMMIRLWPGCACHPVLAVTAPVAGFTAVHVLLWMKTSDGPWVFCIDSH